MVESEDDDKKEQRQTMERKSTEDTRMMLEDRDKEWSEQRLRSRDQAKRKRGRISGLFEDEQKPKRRKRRKYSLLGEHWGAEEGGDAAEPEGGEQQGRGIVYTPVPNIPRPPPLLTTGGTGRGRRQEEGIFEGRRPKTRS